MRRHVVIRLPLHDVILTVKPVIEHASQFRMAVIESFIGLVAVAFVLAEVQVLQTLKLGHVVAGTDDSLLFARILDQDRYLDERDQLITGAVALAGPIWERGQNRQRELPCRRQRWAALGLAFVAYTLLLCLVGILGRL